jgi:2-Cys peroxiredoxin 5
MQVSTGINTSFQENCPLVFPRVVSTLLWLTRPHLVNFTDKLKEAGIDEVLVYCVNDPAVMQAWSADQKVDGKFVKFYADPAGSLTTALDMEMTDPRPQTVGIVGRCKRHALIVADGIIKYFAVSEADDDPAGDSDPSATVAEAMLKAIKDGCLE